MPAELRCSFGHMEESVGRRRQPVPDGAKERNERLSGRMPAFPEVVGVASTTEGFVRTDEET